MSREQDIIDAKFILQQVRLEQFEKEALKQLQSSLNTARRSLNTEISRAINRDYDMSTRERLQALYAEVNVMLSQVNGLLADQIAEAAALVGEYSYVDTAAILSWNNKVPDFNYVNVSARQLKAIILTTEINGNTLQEWLTSAVDVEHKALQAEIQAARIRGIGYKKMNRELRQRYSNLIDSKETKRNLETVAISYMQGMNAQAHNDLFEANRDVMNGVEWSAIMENGNTKTGRGTCPRCMALDGNKYPTEKDGPTRPLHPRCRCMYLPVTKTWRELGLDIDEMDDEYSDRRWYERTPQREIRDTGWTSDMNYADWWQTKPMWWQDNAIGPVRANLVRAGVIEFGEIVDKNGDLIRLDRLGLTVEQLTTARQTS